MLQLYSGTLHPYPLQVHPLDTHIPPGRIRRCNEQDALRVSTSTGMEDEACCPLGIPLRERRDFILFRVSRAI